MPGGDRIRLGTTQAPSLEHTADQPDPFLDPGPTIVKEFVEVLSPFNPDPQDDIVDCLSNLNVLPQGERDKIGAILKADELREWQVGRSSAILIIEPETSPDEIMNGITLATAMLKEALVRSSNVPVLVFFCGTRSNVARDKDVEAGPLALLNSLNYQLLDFLVKNRQTDIGYLTDPKFCRKSTSIVRKSFDLLIRLLRSLPSGDTVYVLLDSYSSISGADSTTQRLLESMLDLATETPDIAVKIMVTDPLPSSISNNATHLKVIVADYEVDGSEGADSSQLEDMAEDSVLKLSHRHSDHEMSDDSSDEDW